MTKRTPTERVIDDGSGQPEQASAQDARLDERLDAELDQTFPASDPVNVTSRFRSRRCQPAGVGS